VAGRRAWYLLSTQEWDDKLIQIQIQIQKLYCPIKNTFK
jgi:hypothetical protein